MSWPAALDRRGFVLVLIAAWALAYLPNLGTRTLRLEEGRRATPAREMLASGDFIRPTLYGDTYLKPPLFYWLVAATGSLLGGVSPLATRLPSALAALGCALVALRFAPDRLDRRTRALAAAFVLASATLLDKGTLGEIDACLCFVVAAALKCWWDGNRPAGQTARSWVAVGTLLGLAGLLKGPAGPALFYLTVGPFLVWQGRWRRLLTVGHFGCVALAVLPAAAWVAILFDRGVVSTPDLLRQWGCQLGAAGMLADSGDRTTALVTHYGEFPLQLLGMLFPAVLWLPFGLRPRRAKQHGVPEDLRRFLVCGVVAPCVAFYLYPESRPRHLMPVFFPAAVLAATTVAAFARGPTRSASRLKSLGLLLALIPAVAGAMGVTLAAWAYPDGLPVAVLCLAVGGLWSMAAVRTTLQTLPEDAVLTSALTLIWAVLSVWFVVNAVVVPWRAPHSTTLIALRQVEGKLIPGEPLFTTRTFPGKGEGYYNLQFHLAADVRSADVSLLMLAAPCAAVVTPGEREQLERSGFRVDELGRFAVRGGPPEVLLIRLSRPGD
ncbi:MAG TPA: glycosyltransferase family 39 protein [Gemmataceae bacterium]|nr:glycosyltransferase family 39 protein [Gemmataceae bacterium]